MTASSRRVLGLLNVSSARIERRWPSGPVAESACLAAFQVLLYFHVRRACEYDGERRWMHGELDHTAALKRVVWNGWGISHWQLDARAGGWLASVPKLRFRQELISSAWHKGCNTKRGNTVAHLAESTRTRRICSRSPLSLVFKYLQSKFVSLVLWLSRVNMMSLCFYLCQWTSMAFSEDADWHVNKNIVRDAVPVNNVSIYLFISKWESVP